MAVNKVVFGSQTLIDITDTTATASDVASGKYIYGADGERAIGTLVGNTINASGSGEVVDDTLVINGGGGSGGEPALQTKTATPTESTQTIVPDSGYDGLSQVTVNPIPSSYIVPTGTTNISSNGTHDVTNYASASVSVQPSLQSKTVTPTTSQQNITADSGYDGLSGVTVNAMPSGSASTPATSITANPSITVSNSGLITATASASQSITPSVTAGYISSGTAGTVTVSGSNTQQLTTQAAKTVTPTTSSQTAVAAGRYTTGAITVAAIPSQYIVPSGTKEITANGTGIDVTAYASVDVNVPTGSSKNIQAYHGYDEVNSGSYIATDVSLTVAKTGTYKVSWMGYRNTTSGTSGSQLYIGNTAYGSANTTFVRSYGQSVVLNNVSLTKDQVITVYARSRNTSYYMGVGNLIIEEQ